MLIKESSRYNVWLRDRACDLDPETAKRWADRLKEHRLIPANAEEEAEFLRNVNRKLRERHGYDVADLSDLAPGGRLHDADFGGNITGGDIYRNRVSRAGSVSGVSPFAFGRVMDDNARKIVVDNAKYRKYTKLDGAAKDAVMEATKAHEAYEIIAMDKARKKRLTLGKDVNLFINKEYNKRYREAYNNINKAILDKYRENNPNFTLSGYLDISKYTKLAARLLTDLDKEKFNKIIRKLDLYSNKLKGGVVDKELKKELESEYKKYRFSAINNKGSMLVDKPGVKLLVPDGYPENMWLTGSHMDESVLKGEHDLVFGNFAPDSKVREQHNRYRRGTEAEAFDYKLDGQYRRENWLGGNSGRANAVLDALAAILASHS